MLEYRFQLLQHHWGVEEETTMQNSDNIKPSITSNFEKLWCNKELEDKRKIIYYKEVINTNIEYPKYLYVLTSV